jgi:FkbM family methyltransferase
VSTLRSDGTGGHARTFEVRTRTLGEILETEAGGCCDWLKIDVEGFEYEILHALPREGFRRIRTLAIEAEPVDASLKNRESLARFLVDMDFDVLLADDAVLYAVNRSYQPRS